MSCESCELRAARCLVCAMSLVTLLTCRPLRQLLTPYPLAALSTALCSASLILLSLTLTLPWQSYSAQNTASSMQWGFSSCYTVPTGIAGGSATVCDPAAPAQLLQACLAIDVLCLLLALAFLAQPFLPPSAPCSGSLGLGSPAFARVLRLCRALAALRAAHAAMCVAALVLKNNSLPASPWAAHLEGWSCLASAIAASCAALLVHLALGYEEAWLAAAEEEEEQGQGQLEEGGGQRHAGLALHSPQVLSGVNKLYSHAAASSASARLDPASEARRGEARQELALRLSERRASAAAAAAAAATPAQMSPPRAMVEGLGISTSGGRPASAPRLLAVPELPMELLRTL